MGQTVTYELLVGQADGIKECFGGLKSCSRELASVSVEIVGADEVANLCSVLRSFLRHKIIFGGSKSALN